MTIQKYIEVAEDINNAVDRAQAKPFGQQSIKEDVKRIAIKHQISMLEVMDMLQDIADSILEILAEDEANRAMFN